MKNTRELTCIVCPKGCQLRVTASECGELLVQGHACPRGKQYAIDECTHPVRTLTTTARTQNGGVIAVKTAGSIPKELMFEAMGEINKATVSLPARVGDCVISDLLGTGIDVIVTANKDA